MKKLFLSGSLVEKDSGGKQTGRVMKLTTVFLLLCSAFAFANPASSQNAKVSLNKQQAHLSEVLEAIESQTDYLFISNRNIDLKQNVSVNVSDVSVREVLETILKNTGLTFKLEGVNIILSKRDEDASSLVTQQDRKITGTVVDQTGYPVIGANVIVKGTTNGTVTDLDGKFSLEVPAGAVLSITYIGYVEQEMKVGNESILSVVLKEDSQALDEVVVVGYGTQKKVNVIGSIAMVGAEKLENRATSSVVSALTGQMPGVTITQPGGRPGDNTGTIRVRGVGSFGATPDALVLIDGIPGNITDINPNDIESVSVLKDASTAAIYGARAANGVVLVTTKLGKEQKVAISYNGYVGFNRATELPQYVDSWDYARLLNQAEGITRFTAANRTVGQMRSLPMIFFPETAFKPGMIYLLRAVTIAASILPHSAI